MSESILELDVHGMTLCQACVAIDAALRRAVTTQLGLKTRFFLADPGAVSMALESLVPTG